MTRDPHDNPDQPHPSHWPPLQVYYVTVEWLDAPHQPESPERLAQAIRHLIEHAHQHPPGADSPPARFVVRVKADEVASEVTGTVTPHHHHHQQP
jgi:hypothetical protein